MKKVDNMIKIVVFDADGMLIRSEFFSTTLSKKYNIPMNEINHFFENEFQNCLIGKADIKKELRIYLIKWNIQTLIDDLLIEWFDFENKIDNRLFSTIYQLSKNGIKSVLATNQEKYRTQYLIKNNNLNNIFYKVYSSALIGYKKPDENFYNYLYQDLKKD